MSKAMVVDDSQVIRLILRKILGKLGYEVLEAAHGRQAVAELERHPEVSLILVDWNMPEMNGLEFVKYLRARPGYSQVTLMMVTTETEIEQMVTALEAGANEYVMKPFTEEIITDKLRLLGLIA
jgi:two-component system chemotaxis response regulator CheY